MRRKWNEMDKAKGISNLDSNFISFVNSICDVRTRNMQRSVEQEFCDKKQHRSHIAICMHYISIC